MGDPRKQRAKYQTPRHPWIKSRIDEEKALVKEYGLKNKKEVWKMNSVVEKFTNQAKKLIALRTKQAELEKGQLMQKVSKLGLLLEGAGIEEVLSLKVKDVLERRLQTLVFRKKLSRSIKQARQFIVHEHIIIDEIKMTIPSYIVSKEEEEKILFAPRSSLVDEMHPERKIEEPVSAQEIIDESTEETKDKSKTESKDKKTEDKVKDKKDAKKSEDKTEKKKGEKK